MTESGPLVVLRRPTPARVDRSKQTLAGFRHIGVSLLPMAAFIIGALGYDRVALAWRGAAKPATVMVEPAVGNVVRTNGNADFVPTQKVGSAQSVAPPGVQVALAMLKDQRSLLDLSRSARDQPGAAATPSAARQALTPRAPATLEQATRTIEPNLAAPNSIPLAIKFEGARAPGNYLLVHGLPQSATLSHGIAVGNDNWLVDGVDIEPLQLQMRSGVAGLMPITLSLMSQDSRVLASEIVALRVVATSPPSAPPVLQPMPAAAMEVPSAAAASASARSQVVLTARPSRDAAPARQSGLRMALESNSKLVAGVRNKLRYQIEPVADIPDGAYMILRGLPQETAMSRGVPIGSDVWLLTLAELAELDVRLPASSGPSLTLGAKLVTVDGQLLAEDRAYFDQEPVIRMPEVPGAARAATASAAVAVAIVEPFSAAPLAPSPSSVGNRPPAEQAQQALVKPAAAPNVSTLAALTRARQMLEVGNIALARPLLERAANGGSAEAAALLGATYDAAWLRRAGTYGVVGNPEKSQHWYTESRRLGGRDIERFTALPTTAGQRNPQR